MARKNKKAKEIEHKKTFNIKLFIITLLVSYVILLIFFQVFGYFYVKSHIFIFDNVVKIFIKGFEIIYDDKNNIQCQINYFQGSPGNAVPAQFTITTPGSIMYIIPVIVYSLICAWPLELKRKFLLFLIAGFFIEMFHIIDIPLYWINQLKLYMGVPSWFSLIWENIASNGGRHFIAIIIFFISLKIVNIYKYH